MQKIPITIGIVGHRDAIITQEHQEKILQVFKDISTQYPNSPIVLFSQLAIGADTAVAQLFLDYKKQNNCNFQLIVPFTYNVAYFKKTQFATQEQLDTFNQLLSQSERSFTLNQLSKETKALLDKDKNAYCKELDAFYRLGGEFIADSAIVLIALWENFDNKLEGGSANIVTYKKTGSYQKFISEHIFDTQGNLVSIACNRAGNNRPLQFEDNYFSNLLQDSSIKKALDKIEALNTAHIEKTVVNKSANYLFPKENTLDSNTETLKNIFAFVDAKANKNQLNYNRILKGLFILGFVIFGVFETYKHLGLHQELFFATLALLAFAFGVFKFSYNWKNHKKYIENRVLSEALRVQFFWNIARIKKSVSKYVLRIHKKEYNWLKHILLAIYGYSYLNDNSKKENTATIKKYWIDNQKNYFTKKVEELEVKEKNYKIVSYLFFGAGILVLIAIYCINLKNEHSKYIHLLIVLDSMFFGLFALIKAYFEKKGYEQIKTQYTLMQSIYTASSKKIDEIDQLNNANEIDEIDHILFLTGKEAVVENGNWYMIYKDKKPEVEGIG